MKAVIYDKKSPTEKLTFCDVEKPVPNDNELLIEIHSASVNAADYRMLQLGFPPKKKIFGADISGIVEAVGKNINNFKPGDQVIGELSDLGFGGFAEYVCASEKGIIHKPENISFETASALPLAAITALQALHHKNEIRKQVLIIGCSGGVGTYAIQIAKYYGAVVTGICSTKNMEQAYISGADKVIDYSKTDLKKLNERYDLILGINGNYPLGSCRKLLNINGRYTIVGGQYRQIFKAALFGRLMSSKSKKIDILAAKTDINDIEFIIKLASEGKIKPVIDKIFPLEKTADAFQYIREKHAQGKVVIRIK